MPAEPANNPETLPPAVVPPPPPPGPDSEERTLAMLCHILPIVAGFIAPLVIWLIKKDQSRFLDHHGREALNFQINVLVITLILTGAAVALMIIFIGLLFLPLLFLVGIAALILEVLAGLAASRGEWHRYPCTVRIL
jgi:uncharacterized Tic20 family protein